MNKKKKIILFLGIGLLIVCGIGISYAYWVLTFSQNNPNKLVTSCLSLSLTNEKNDINLEKAYPISDEEGKKLTPYSFTITNTCDLFLSYTINLEILKETTMPYKYIKAMVNSEAITNLKDLESTEVTLDNATTSKILLKGTLGTEDSSDYTLRLWMDENVTVEDTDAMNTIFLSKVTISAQRSTYTPIDAGYNTLADAILANEYQTSPEISKQKIASKQTPDFSKTAPILIWNESKSNMTSNISAKMPHPDLVALKDSDERFKNLTAENVLLSLGTSYSIDQTSGKYNLVDVNMYDPTILNYDNGEKYYFCGAGYNTNSNDIVSPWVSNTGCPTIYELTGATYVDGTSTGSGGTSIKTRNYNLKGYSLTQTEQESDKSDKGLYQMEDDDGVSYYYRGSVTNNYMKFAGFYWRILRINGDGSVRLLYAGAKVNSMGIEALNKKNVSFNNLVINPAYSGFMYGSILNESYEKTTANEMNSNIKSYLEEWYQENILNTNNERFLADAGFCNDRSLVLGDGYSESNSNINYGFYQRYYQTKEPTLKCPQINDLFTLKTNTKGNKVLLYPIGLITGDELMISGLADGYINKSTYTYTNYTYWTMSPSYYNSTLSTARAFFLDTGGFIAGYNNVTIGLGVRAVINIKGDTKISGGIGTSSSPYEIIES